MNMTSYICKKRKQKLKNVKRGALIKFKLNCQELKFVDIAKDLGISKSAVYRSIYGLSKITRVDDWLEENIGLKFDYPAEKVS